MPAFIEKLVFDIGFHRGEDTAYYLQRGYDVIAVEASPALYEQGREKFAAEISRGQLKLLNFAVGDFSQEVTSFFLSENTVWNSANKQVSDRFGNFQQEILVPAISLGDLIGKYGLPFYCKIDIEGMDLAAIQSLALGICPPYLSCESECYGYHEVFTEEQSLATLDALLAKDYCKFKIVEQEGLEEIWQKKQRYIRPDIVTRAIRKIGKKLGVNIVQNLLARRRKRYQQRYDFPFPEGASGTGPLAEDFREGNWLDYKTTKELLLYYRRQKLAYDGMNLWFDLHASR